MIAREPLQVDKLATLDAQAIVGMLMRFYVRQAQRRGWVLDHTTARDAAIASVFGGMPEKPEPQARG